MGNTPEREERVMEALRKCLLGDRAIPDQHEQWWRNLAREAIEAADAGVMVTMESLRHERNEWRKVAVKRKRDTTAIPTAEGDA